MDDEPPSDFVTFVAVHLDDAQREAARLTGGSDQAPEVCTQAFADLAGRWRRLQWHSRLARRDVRPDALRARLTRRTEQWREDQLYPVEVSPLTAPALTAPVRAAVRSASLALRKAVLLPDTDRAPHRGQAEAAIAWGDAYRRHRYHVIARVAVTVVVAFGAAGKILEAIT